MVETALQQHAIRSAIAQHQAGIKYWQGRCPHWLKLNLQNHTGDCSAEMRVVMTCETCETVIDKKTEQPFCPVHCIPMQLGEDETSRKIAAARQSELEQLGKELYLAVVYQCTECEEHITLDIWDR